MRIAIIGSGIAGHSAAICLHLAPARHDVTLYEREARAGGHSATAEIDYDGARIAVDTGFIVYNTLNYPNLTAFFDWAGVATQQSDMSFSVSAGRGSFEWCGRDSGSVLGGLFAQKRNAVSPGFLKMLLDIRRFQNTARADLAAGTIGAGSLESYLARHGFGERLRRDYLVPMGAAIWSTSPAAMLEFPAESFIAFFDNHCLLQWNRPKWRTVTGGSRNYVAKIAAILGPRLRLASPVARVRRTGEGVEVIEAGGATALYDKVVIAAHAPQALALLADATPREHAILAPVRTAPNDVWLHRDTRLMPRRKAAWAAWNYLREGGDATAKVAVTYWMNLLQGIDSRHPLFITLNPPFEPNPALTFGRYSYAHPQFDAPALNAVKQLESIQGNGGVSFCGAWTAHGFHEDGMRSGLQAALRLGALPPWRNMPAAPAGDVEAFERAMA